MAQRNIEIILAGLADAVRARDPERLADLLDPDVVWDGPRPDQHCEGRPTAMRIIAGRFAAAPLEVDAVEVVGAGEHVVVGLRGPGFNGIPGDVTTVGQVYNVFTLRGGKVVRWRAFAGREEAIAAAGASGENWR